LNPKKFTKRYKESGQFLDLPAQSYWLLREESILSYLFQRGAKVPKVFLKNIEDQSITLEYVGESFDQLFLRSKNESSTSFFQCILLAATETLKIFDLGVLHLDIAARNFTRQTNTLNDIYVLDFAHCISSNHVLQKPIPLLPQSQIQHPELVEALKSDWKLFFIQSKKQIPNLDEKFEVNNQSFSDYWKEGLAVQNLQKSYGVLSHELGQFFLEMSNSDIITRDDKIYLINLGQNLCFIENDSAQICIEQTLIDLRIYSENLSTNFIDNNTRIPIVKNTLPNDSIVENESKLNQTNQEKKNLISRIIGNISPILQRANDSDVLETAPITIVSKISKSEIIQIIKLSIKNIVPAWRLAFLIWSILISHVFWLDFMITEIRLQLPNWLVYVILSLVFFMFIRVLISSLKGRISYAFALELPSLILFSQLMVTGFVTIKTNGNLLVWVPSAITYLTIIILIFQNQKRRISFYSAQ